MPREGDNPGDRPAPLEQIALLEKQLGELEEAIAELRRIHTMLAGKAGAANE
jgi:hypothetical protein